MNIKIFHRHLLEFLVTSASPIKIARCLSLSGPSVERLEKVGKDWVYEIEITTNRADSASVYGIAKEAAAILPQYGIKAKLKEPQISKIKAAESRKNNLKIKIDPKFVRRVMAATLEGLKSWETPKWMKERLAIAGIRPLGAPIDITNYVMVEIGHPSHVFDYERINTHTLVFREADKGEKIIGLDDKTYTLAGGDMVIDNGEGEIIDLPGILGAKNSVVNKNTQKIIFFIDNLDPARIRKTSMGLGLRTAAASLNEKGVDPALAELAFERGLYLFQEITKARVVGRTYNLYPAPYQEKKIEIKHDFIEQRLGITIQSNKVVNILEGLGFGVVKKASGYKITIPSRRANDIAIPEDIVEEVARIYGYQNLPSKLMQGELPRSASNVTFSFESKVKNILKGLGGAEIYTLSLVGKEFVRPKALRLRNPLGAGAEYLRTSLMPSLLEAARGNAGEKESFHFFEMANTYFPKKGSLPKEEMKLGGVFANTSYREGKGIIESLLSQLKIEVTFEAQDESVFVPGKRVIIKSGLTLGEFGEVEGGLLYYEFPMEGLAKANRERAAYQPLPKFPAQIEDITLELPPRTKIGEVIKALEKEALVERVRLGEIYQDSYTFRVWYQHPEKTLANEEVEKIRYKIIKEIKNRFGGVVKN